MQLKVWVGDHAKAVRRTAWCAAVVVLLYVLAWLAVPSILRSQLQTQGSEILGRQVTVASVSFNPLTLELVVRDVAIAAASGKSPQFAVARIYINAAVQSFWRLAPVIDALQVDAPVVHVTQTEPGKFDFDDIVQRFAHLPATPAAGKPLRFALYNVQLQGGAVDFEDQTVHVKHALSGITLSLPFVSNLPADREVKVQPKLAFEFDGSAFKTTAEATPFARSHQAQARLQVKDFDLASLAAYVPASLGVKLDAARLSADLGLDFVDRENAPEVRLTGTTQLDNVDVSDTKGQKLFSLDSLRLELGDVYPLQRQVEIASVDLKGPHVWLQRDASGKVLLPGAGSAAPVAAHPAPGAAPWKFAVQQLQVSDGALDWRDDSLREADARTVWQVRHWQAQVQGATWPLGQATQFSSTLQLADSAATGVPPAQFDVQGKVSARGVQAKLALKDASVALAAPYLAQYLRPVVSGTLDATASLEQQGDALTLKVQQLRLDNASVSCAARRGCPTLRQAGVAGARSEEQVALGQLEIADASIDLKRHHVQIERVALQDPQVLAARSKSGAWMFEDWLLPTPKASAGAENGAPGWTVALGALQVKGGTVALRDEGARSPVALHVSALDVGVHDLVWDQGRLPAFGLRVQARVGTGKADPGQLAWDGTLAVMPELQAKGRLRTKNLPLQVVQAWLPDELNVDVVRADGDFTGDIHLAQVGEGLKVGVQGDAALGDVQVRLKPDHKGKVQAQETADGVQEDGSGDLLRWKALSLRGLSLALAPGQPLALDVRNMALTDFYARVIVQENGRINLQDMGRAAAPGAAADSRSAPAPTAHETAAANTPSIHFGPVALTNGTVDFTDHFIKPNYSANLTELTGSLSAFSSQEPSAGAPPQMAQLELEGRAQGTATLEISGQLNPLAKPLALDIQGHMRDLELPPLSPYSVKYAGHGIERGKLNVDVAYKVQPDGKLTATNKLVLKQLAFGDAVKGAPNSLPVRLAVALLADRNGVIDMDLPISGSLNDPDFSLGPVIMKVVGNLILKAITAPFSLIAHAFSGGDEKGDVTFAPGSSTLTADARTQLDGMGKALVDRPALKATVVGWADPETEIQGWKHERLMDMLLAEKRREAVQARQDATKVTQVSDSEYAGLLKRVYQHADDIKKPRNMIGLAKDIPQAEMEKLLLESVAVPDNAMQELALARSVAVRDYLATQEVPMDRLFIGASKLFQAGAQSEDATPHVQLELAAD